MAGGLVDMVWPVLLGIEVSVEALYSPSHLVLAVGGVLIVSGPLRAGLRRRTEGRSGLPMLLSATLLLSVFTFFTQISHPAVDAAPREKPPHESTNELYSMHLDGTSRTRLTVGNNGSCDMNVDQASSFSYGSWRLTGPQTSMTSASAAAAEWKP
ncbi:MAG: hypothetical protein ACRDJ4_11350 [Actinomycetota bacterium]